ncbi:MAG: ELM1/GtrOC1 family putative glycosyltransferase, partial [Nitratireductor sp.]
MTEKEARLPKNLLAEPQRLTCWVLTNGMAGFETQGIGIAEALGLTPEMKRVAPSAPWKWMAPWGPAQPDEHIAPPWPDILIASGRQSIPYARMIRRKSGGRTFTIVLQDPRIAPVNFDFVWAPAHDRLEGPNVLSTAVSPHRLTRARLAEEAALFEPQVARLPRPRVAVLIGGTNSVYRLTAETAADIAGKLAAVADKG